MAELFSIDSFVEIIKGVIIVFLGLFAFIAVDKLCWKRLILQNKDLFFDLYRDRILEAFEKDYKKE